MIDLFAALGLPRQFSIDLSQVERKYFDAQRLVHPDRLRGKSASERQQAVSFSMMLNEAYETLKDPLKRARHLLALSGADLESAKPSPEVLMENMELREQLDEADTNALLLNMAGKNSKAVEAAFQDLTQSFATNNSSRATDFMIRLSYLTKLGMEIQNKIRKLAS